MIIPHVQKESNHGISCIPVTDEMLVHRTVVLNDEVNADTAEIVNAEILYLADKDPGKEIILRINSPGGEISSGMSIVDTIRTCGCPVTGICVGTSASMGAIIFESCGKRIMYPHAEIMIHDPLLNNGGGTALSVADQVDRLMAKRDMLADVLSQRTGLERSRVLEMTAKDCWISAEQAVKENFADEILQTMKEVQDHE